MKKMRNNETNKISSSQENVDQSRRRLTQMAWTTPVVAAITLPAHAQTSATTTPSPTEYTCTVTQDTEFTSPGFFITFKTATISPVPPEFTSFMCRITSNDPNYATIDSSTAFSDDVGSVLFLPFQIPNDIVVGSVITSTITSSDVFLAPCSTMFIVSP